MAVLERGRGFPLGERRVTHISRTSAVTCGLINLSHNAPETEGTGFLSSHGLLDQQLGRPAGRSQQVIWSRLVTRCVRVYWCKCGINLSNHSNAHTDFLHTSYTPTILIQSLVPGVG